MDLSNEQKRIVQSTFEKIEANPEPFAASLYGRLFEQNSGLKNLFKADMKSQGDVLIRMLTLAVGGLDHPDDLTPVLHDLGLHHAGYGVKAEDYKTFGTAMILALREFLGAGFTPEIAAAWEAFYQLLATESINGMKD